MKEIIELIQESYKVKIPKEKQTQITRENPKISKVLYDKEGEYKMLEDITYKFWKNNDKKGY